MKRVRIIVAALCVIATILLISYSTSKYSEYEVTEVDRCREILSQMTLEQKVGQMFMAGFSSNSLDEATEELFRECMFGNVILFTNNIVNAEQAVEINNDLRSHIEMVSEVEPFVAVDQEGGPVMRVFDGATDFPSNMAVAATGNPENAYSEGLMLGRELASMGFNMDLAPCVDVNSNPNNPVIGVRSYSDNPKLVGEFASEFIRGMQESRVLACAKHFPGHGDTSVDSHYGLPVIDKDIEEIREADLYPFKVVVENGAEAVMSTHIVFEAIDEKLPATLSPAVLTGVLRGELGFDGLIVTDGMQMGAIVKNFGIAEGCVMAVKAGADLLVTGSGNMSQSDIRAQRDAYLAVVNAVRNGEIGEDRIDESVMRILQTKESYGLLDANTTDIKLTDYVQSHGEFSRKLNREAVTVVKDETGLIPIGDDRQRVLAISHPMSRMIWDEMPQERRYNSFSYAFSMERESVDALTVDYSPSIQDVQRARDMADDYDVVVIAFGDVAGNSSQRRLIEEVFKANANVVLVCLGSPYDSMKLDQIPSIVCTYQYTRSTRDALNGVLSGRYEAVGRLPVKLPF